MYLIHHMDAQIIMCALAMTTVIIANGDLRAIDLALTLAEFSSELAINLMDHH